MPDAGFHRIKTVFSPMRYIQSRSMFDFINGKKKVIIESAENNAENND